MPVESISPRTIDDLQRGVHEERTAIRDLEAMKPHERLTALKEAITGAIESVPDHQWDRRPVFLIDYIVMHLRRYGVTPEDVTNLLNDDHVVHLLEFWPEVRAALRRFDIQWHRHNLETLEGTLRAQGIRPRWSRPPLRPVASGNHDPTGASD
jgi:hypothetical protein